MTNKYAISKLPEIGKRYKDRNDKRKVTTFIGIYEGKLVHALHYLNHKGQQIMKPTSACFCDVEDFWEWFEELPEEEPITNSSKNGDNLLKDLVAWAVKPDKLPEVGKRYKHKRDQNIVKAVYIFEHGDITLEAEGGRLLGEMPSVYLQEHYEELPDQEPTTESKETYCDCGPNVCCDICGLKEEYFEDGKCTGRGELEGEG